MGRAAHFRELAAYAHQRALTSRAFYDRVVWLDIAQQWCELAEFATAAERFLSGYGARKFLGEAETNDSRLAAQPAMDQ
jgi:hypothetical protein